MTQESFGQCLRLLRTARGMSLRDLATRAHVSRAAIGHAETGVRTPTDMIAVAVDRALDAGGVLVALARTDREGGDDMYRRTLLIQLATLAATGPLVRGELDAARDAINDQLGATVDDWVETAEDYGRAYLRTSPREIQAHLARDLSTLRVALDRVGGKRLPAVAARLALLNGMATASSGDPIGSMRWYRTAERLAAKDDALRVWVRGRVAFRRGYDAGDPDEVLGLAAGVSSVEAHLAAAQAYAALGAATEALGELESAQRAYDTYPATAPNSIFDLPPWRMAIASGLVHARLGAIDATEQVLTPADSPRVPLRWRAQARLTVALAEGYAGEPGAYRVAAGVLEEVPEDQRSGTLLHMAEEVRRCGIRRR